MPAAQPPAPDLAGYSSAKTLAGTPLTAADVAFYLRIMHAAVDRARHPSPSDLRAVAAARAATEATVSESKKLMAAVRAHDLAAYNALAAAAQRDQKSEQATIGAGMRLVQHMDEVEAARTRMPARQWDALSNVIESASMKMPEALQFYMPDKRVFDADEAEVRPYKNQITQLIVELKSAEADLYRSAGA